MPTVAWAGLDWRQYLGALAFDLSSVASQGIGHQEAGIESPAGIPTYALQHGTQKSSLLGWGPAPLLCVLVIMGAV